MGGILKAFYTILLYSVLFQINLCYLHSDEGLSKVPEAK